MTIFESRCFASVSFSGSYKRLPARFSNGAPTSEMHSSVEFKPDDPELFWKEEDAMLQHEKQPSPITTKRCCWQRMLWALCALLTIAVVTLVIVVVAVVNSAVPLTPAPTSALTFTPTAQPTTPTSPTLAPTRAPTFQLCVQVNQNIPQSALTKAKRPGKIRNIVVAVVTNGQRQTEIVPAIKETWGADFEHIEFYSAVPLPGVVDKVVPTNASYVRSTFEEMHAWRILYESNPHAEWYMKTDDDAYVNTRALKLALESFPSDKDWYLGSPLTYPKLRGGGLVHYCAGGAGSLMSNSMMKKFYTTLHPTIRLDYKFSDVQVGASVMQLLNTDKPVCTILSPYVIRGWLFQDIQLDQHGSLQLRGAYLDSNGNRVDRFDSFEDNVKKIPMMHYTLTSTQRAYYAMFQSVERCEHGETDVETFTMIITRNERLDRPPSCKPSTMLQFSCVNKRARFKIL